MREIISSEMWEQVNKAYLMVTDAAAAPARARRSARLFSAVKQAAHLFVGITVRHDDARRSVALRPARAAPRARRQDVAHPRREVLSPAARKPSDVGTTYDEIQWAALLRSASAFEMYRKRHGRIDPTRVVDFLLLERTFPRSIVHCLSESEKSLRAITGTPDGTAVNAAERELGRLHAHLEYAVTAEVIAKGLHEYLDGFQLSLNAVGDAIHDTFFALARPSEEEASLEHGQGAPQG